MSEIPEMQNSSGGREKQKVRIKFQQRTKIKSRPRGFKVKRFWKKHQKSFFAYLILSILISATVVMVVDVVKQQMEENKHYSRYKNQRRK